MPRTPRVVDWNSRVELHEYSQYQCAVCGFRTRSPDEQEVAEIVTEHAEREYGEALDRAEIETELRTLELEGYTENS